jgi:beta-galactosidase
MTSPSRRDVLRSGIAAGVGSLVANTAAARAEGLLGAAPDADGAAVGRERLLLDFGWRFTFGHGSDPAKDLGFGAEQEAFSKSGEFGFARAGFDDAKWRELDLPHDWAVELPFVHDESLQSHGYKPLGRKYPETSVGWYRKTFAVPKEDKGRRIAIDFDGAFRSALVFLNGYYIGRNENGYAPFSLDVTDYLLYGEANALVVRMDASFGDGWFYEGAGIYRHVWLRKTAALHLAQWESVVRSEVTGRVATLSLDTVVANQGAAAADARVRWEILDAAGRTVATAASVVRTVAGRAEQTFSATTKLADAALWSPESPSLYRAVVTVESAGRPVDAEEVRFGVRTIRFDAEKGFFLNGKPVKIKGTCNHQDHAGVGAALPDGLQRFRLAVLKSMGSNAVRTSHNMPTPEWVEACDRMGMMMMCETRSEASNPEGLEQLSVMVKRYRNSPAIVLWSIGNEETVLQESTVGEEVGASMVARAHALDPTRLCTAAVNNHYGTGVSKALDVEGFNYNLGRIEAYHASHAKQPLVGTETASTVATRGIYETDKLRNWVSAYDVNFPSWASTAEAWWKVYGTREYLPGGFAWTGFDYRGEPTPYGWPSISSQFGIVDMCGYPKDDFYYYKAWWGTEPVLHLLPHWNWEERVGQPVEVWVHSNLDEVELLLNGKSLGSKRVEPLTHLAWKVPYEPGTLEARGSRGGKVVLTERRETTGKIASLRLTPDRTVIDADGEDVAVLRVEALDAQGRAIPTADDLVHFKISGAGRLIGVGNGDPNCQESDKEPKRSLFNGLAQVIVQATKASGEITIEASTDPYPGPKVQAEKAVVRTRTVKSRASL